MNCIYRLLRNSNSLKSHYQKKEGQGGREKGIFLKREGGKDNTQVDITD